MPKKSFYDDEFIAFTSKIIETFNSVFHRRFRAPDNLYANISYWREVYSDEEILSAIQRAKFHHFWYDKITPQILFRKRNPQGEPVDYLGEFLNYQIQQVKVDPKRPMNSFEAQIAAIKGGAK